MATGQHATALGCSGQPARPLPPPEPPPAHAHDGTLLGEGRETGNDGTATRITAAPPAGLSGRPVEEGVGGPATHDGPSHATRSDAARRAVRRPSRLAGTPRDAAGGQGDPGGDAPSHEPSTGPVDEVGDAAGKDGSLNARAGASR
eukprot:2750514-Pleurochrysis_carterae.AAC.1